MTTQTSELRGVLGGLSARAEYHGGYVTPGMLSYWLSACSGGVSNWLIQQDVRPEPMTLARVKELVAGNGQAQDYMGRLLNLPDMKARAKPIRFSATYRRWDGVLDQSTLTNAEVTHLGHRLSNLLGGGPGHRTNMVRYEAIDLYIKLRCRVWGHAPYQLTPEQVEKGIAWLRSPGVQREIRKYYGDELAERAAQTRDFRFIGYVTVPGTGSACIYKPVYRALNPHGRFDYWASPWVDGRGQRFFTVDAQEM